jgi:hypothetical protein
MKEGFNGELARLRDEVADESQILMKVVSWCVPIFTLTPVLPHSFLSTHRDHSKQGELYGTMPSITYIFGEHQPKLPHDALFSPHGHFLPIKLLYYCYFLLLATR